jgi:hypothetical protein
MNRSTPALLALGLAACLQQGSEPTTSETEQAASTCLPGGSYCKTDLPVAGYYDGFVPTLTEDYQVYLLYECNGSTFGAAADTKAGKITWNVDVTKAIPDYVGKAATRGNRRLVKTPPGNIHPHCPLAGELLYFAQGYQDLVTTAPEANDVCLGN